MFIPGIDRERGAALAGTRITVYDVLDYLQAGHHPSYIAAALGISSTEVLMAMRYIEENKAEVWAEYQKMLERDARGNPPEIQARLDATHAKYQALWAKSRQTSDQETPGEGRACRQ